MQEIPPDIEAAVQGAMAAAVRQFGERLDYLLDDARQEAYLACWKARTRDMGNRSNYLFHVAQNAIRRYMRREWQSERGTLPTGQTGAVAWSADQGTVVPHAEHRLTNTLDELAAACRDSTDRRIIRLRRRGYTLEECGERIQLTKGAISKRLRRLAARAGIKIEKKWTKRETSLMARDSLPA